MAGKVSATEVSTSPSSQIVCGLAAPGENFMYRQGESMLSLRKNLTVVALVALTVAAPAFASVTQTGKAVFKTTVVTETIATFTTSTGYVSLPGASASITVPAGKKQLVSVRFSAESQCVGSVNSWCSVRIVANGVEMLPNQGTDFAFDASNGSLDDFWESNAVERTLVLPGGTYTISVEYMVRASGLTFRLDDWTMAVTQHNSGN
jgi:archaellum component FlaF (FlaF/FlaG flagellin family)